VIDHIFEPIHILDMSIHPHVLRIIFEYSNANNTLIIDLQ
jgi:hypothetical protein